ncbi:sigma-E processing peptidase SpoIIGA [Irregularibacter muris]|uniref:Sporulation sigma-E factor-processing peptidase n=1 Tax=Irregularibacter muris TaxID=1796619 RepID=A0AAE3HEI8_9FIRM|nr:sigma-E processing peptidase SpoIIGA [Irregularibacter muris]MCR1898027.1 sigma-E processing peptidase SpoIIGA [Irregularibacter muris]
MTYIYGDIIVVENFIINFIIIWLTVRFSKIRTHVWKILIGAFIGAAYTLLIYFPLLNIFNEITMKICLSIIIIIVVFTPKKIKDFIRPFAIFYLISFIFGGSAFALIYMTQYGGLSSKGFFYVSKFPISLLLITCLLSYFLIKVSWDYIQSKISKDNILTNIHIDIDGKVKELKGLFDTANFLNDPISKSPVIVVEYSIIKDVLPIEIREIFNENQEKDFEHISQVLIHSDWINRFRMIPFTSLGEKNGLLVGFKTDKITIVEKEKNKEVNNVIMAIYNQKLSNEGEYNALLNPEILNIQT